MTGTDDVSYYHRPATVETFIGDHLAGWLSADMDSLAYLLDVTDATVIRGEVLASARRLQAALAAVLESVEET